MILRPSDDKCSILKINTAQTRNTSDTELLCLIINHKLKFDAHYARFEFHALRRIRNFLTLKEAKLLANSLVTTYFGYTSLIGIFTSKSSILKVTKIHWRTLHVVYDDYNSIYEELLDIHNDISIH